MPGKSTARILPEADEYVKEWNAKRPEPGCEMVSFSTWYKRVFNAKPDNLSVDYVRRYARAYPYKH